ncbi:MAG TPA: GNAT family N-acetyltransferase [Thermoanaerobaculia bacterium]
MAAHLLADLPPVPDIPRWLETRAMLRSPHVTVTGGQDGGKVGWVVRLVHGAISALAVVGCPPIKAIGSALEGVTELTPIMAQDDNADHVERALIDLTASRGGQQWKRERVILHRLTSSPALPHVDVEQTFAIRLLKRGDSLEHLFPELRHEITHAREMAPVAVAFVGGQPVSFCYPVWTTESMWDVSIDTLADHRRHGLAAHVSRFMTEHMRREGREPIWAALESNAASLGLAARLGFTPADECVVFSHGAWVFLSGGFTG